jgi:hypothetical protein
VVCSSSGTQLISWEELRQGELKEQNIPGTTFLLAVAAGEYSFLEIQMFVYAIIL